MRACSAQPFIARWLKCCLLQPLICMSTPNLFLRMCLQWLQNTELHILMCVHGLLVMAGNRIHVLQLIIRTQSPSLS